MGNKKKIIVGFAIVISVLIIVLKIFVFKTDGMENKGIYNLKYKTYSNKKWTGFKKNGITCGKINANSTISNIKIKARSNDALSYKVYSRKNGWSANMSSGNILSKNQEISGISINIYKKTSRKYHICYRTYNDDDKWLGWSCNGDINGNADKGIKAIEIKVIPKNAVENEYLRGYNISDLNNKNF